MRKSACQTLGIAATKASQTFKVARRTHVIQSILELPIGTDSITAMSRHIQI